MPMSRPFSLSHSHSVFAGHLAVLLLTSVVGCALFVGAAAPAYADEADREEERQRRQAVATYWSDFNHYVLIRRPDMAQAAAESLLEIVGDDDQTLVEVVEAGDYRDYERSFRTARNIDELRDVAERLEWRVQAARITRARDEERIVRDIQRLGAGQRAFRNAVERLAAAGQFAVPQMLATLEDPQQRHLHPAVISALVTMGHPTVYPLSEALLGADPVTKGQIAQVLARIGYSLPLPYMKHVLEHEELDSNTREKLERAYGQLLRSAEQSRQLSAAELYLNLATNQYSAATFDQRLPGFDEQQNEGVAWEYHREIGLVPVHVPPQIHGDVLAMRSARRALTLEPDMDAALSRWLMANLRRANLLGDGERDPSYGRNMEVPSFYAMIAGPRRLHDVLDRALRDNDPRLALDAILALSHTAGTEALVALDAGRQPLLSALSYPDRRVRFHAALTLAQARPHDDFPEAHRVVPILAEAVRHDDTDYALVLAGDQDTLNRRLGDLGELGYEAFGGTSLGSVRDQLRRRPGVDVVVIDMPVEVAGHTFRQTMADHQLGAAPVVIVASIGEQYRLRQDIGRDPRLFMSERPQANDDATTQWPQPLADALGEAADAHAGATIGAAEAERFAMDALGSLRDIALASGVYRVEDALSALIVALEDERGDIARAAAGVLAVIEEPEAQRALARRAFAEQGELRIVMLENLGDSAIHHGNMLEQRQTDRLLEMVRTSSGETALAAARAHGALALPTANAVRFILDASPRR